MASLILNLCDKHLALIADIYLAVFIAALLTHPLIVLSIDGCCIIALIVMTHDD